MAVSPASAYAGLRGDLRPAGATGGTYSTHDALVDGLDQELRALVRAEGVDLLRDSAPGGMSPLEFEYTYPTRVQDSSASCL